MPVAKCNTKSGWGRGKKRYHDRVEKGLCILCDNKPEHGLRWCIDCKAKESERSKQKRLKAAADGKCESCPNKAMQLTRAAGQNRLGGQYVEGRSQSTYCAQCYLKSRAFDLLGSRRHWEVLVEKLEACRWRCPYTGETLVLGDNLSFDHIDPISRFPERKHDPNNIEPVSWQVNVMKRDLTKQEFLALIERIYSHADFIALASHTSSYPQGSESD